ncbi:hypothetical protein GCM10010271_34820 [Streptomyces kurssanovii]|nr:hypothetical protein GCM10010271_34820 [Streptomyces kurssanovii]
MQITNHGPGDVYGMDVKADEGEELITRNQGEFPVPKLPTGKSVRLLTSRSLGSGASSYFNVVLTGKTADGVPIEGEEFVDGA